VIIQPRLLRGAGGGVMTGGDNGGGVASIIARKLMQNAPGGKAVAARFYFSFCRAKDAKAAKEICSLST